MQSLVWLLQLSCKCYKFNITINHTNNFYNSHHWSVVNVKVILWHKAVRITELFAVCHDYVSFKNHKLTVLHYKPVCLRVGESVFSSHIVLPQMIWQGQHWSQHHQMPGHLTPCTPRSWPQASLTQLSLTQRPLPLLQPSTPRWGTNRCVFLLSSIYLFCVFKCHFVHIAQMSA